MKARRMKRMGQRTYTFTFSWDGGEYIDVAFEGCIPHDAIGNVDPGMGQDVFRAVIKAYLTGVDRDRVLEAFLDKRVAA